MGVVSRGLCRWVRTDDSDSMAEKRLVKDVSACHDYCQLYVIIVESRADGTAHVHCLPLI